MSVFDTSTPETNSHSESGKRFHRRVAGATFPAQYEKLLAQKAENLQQLLTEALMDSDLADTNATGSTLDIPTLDIPALEIFASAPENFPHAR